MGNVHSPKHRASGSAVNQQPFWQRTAASKGILVLSVASVLALSGCSIPGLPGPTGAPAVEQAAAIAPVPEQTPAATAAPVIDLPPAIAGEMATGAVSHTLGAAENQLVIDYWTSENPATWTPETSPIIRLSASVAGAVDKKTIKITRFNARVDATDTVLTNDTGDFAVDAPHSYSSSIVVPGNTSAQSTRIIFTFDLLTETAPASGIFTRQTVMDTLTLQYAVPAQPVTASTAAQN